MKKNNYAIISPTGEKYGLKIANHCHYHKKLARELIQGINTFHTQEEFLLTIEDESLALCSKIHNQKTCFTHSFSGTRLRKRAIQKNQLLLKACNNKKREIHSIIDLTAGWGKDSFILATHGQQITLVEQNPLIYQCLNFLLGIAQSDNTESIYKRMQVINQNGVDYLASRDAGFIDCLYLDPMFPTHKSSARPAKDLQILQLLTENLDIQEMFSLALNKAKYRVVVKRPLNAKPLNDLKPDIVYREKTIRFDVYLTNI